MVMMIEGLHRPGLEFYDKLRYTVKKDTPLTRSLCFRGSLTLCNRSLSSLSLHVLLMSLCLPLSCHQFIFCLFALLFRPCHLSFFIRSLLFSLCCLPLVYLIASHCLSFILSCLPLSSLIALLSTLLSLLCCLFLLSPFSR